MMRLFIFFLLWLFAASCVYILYTDVSDKRQSDIKYILTDSDCLIYEDSDETDLMNYVLNRNK